MAAYCFQCDGDADGWRWSAFMHVTVKDKLKLQLEFIDIITVFYVEKVCAASCVNWVFDHRPKTE